MTLSSAHRSFEGFHSRGRLFPCNRFTPDQRSTIASTRYCERVTAPADISKVLIKFLLRLCSYTIYSVVKYRPTPAAAGSTDRKSTRLNSSHQIISYAVFCLKKKKKREQRRQQGNSRRSRVSSVSL